MEALFQNHNFSKIGKYISNKLHHIHKTRKDTPKTQPSTSQTTRNESSSKAKEEKQNRVRRKIEWVQPTVGSYHVNYSIIDKNIHNTNFTRSTPHFFGQKYRINQITPCLKDYPDGLPARQKGMAEIGRMTGREQIKGYVRKNMQNPHQSRFFLKKFPVLTQRSGTLPFAKMSPRKDIMKHGLPLPDYDANYEVAMHRLDSHIISFEKQTSRYQQAPKAISFDDYRTEDEHGPVLIDKTVCWSKQLPREMQGTLPTYMDKTIHSRMGLSLVNLKTLEMNCSDLKVGEKKLGRRKLGEPKGGKYKQKNCLQE